MNKFFITAVMAGLSICDISAAPANPQCQQIVQPDGTIVEARLTGDEHSNHAITSDGKVLKADIDGFYREVSTLRWQDNCKSLSPTVSRSLNDGKVPTTGTLKGLVILAQYSDFEFAETNTQNKFHRLLNETGYCDDGATGSVRDWYSDQSNELFTPEFDVVGPVTLSHQMSYYGADSQNTTDENAYRMIEEAVRLADENMILILPTTTITATVRLIWFM